MISVKSLSDESLKSEVQSWTDSYNALLKYSQPLIV